MPYWRALIPIGIALALWWLGINPLDRLIGGTPPAMPEGVAQSRPSISDCRPTAAEVAATEVAGTLDGGATPTPITNPIVTTELVVLAGDRDVPRLLPSLVFRAPAEEHADLNAFLSASLSAVESEAAPDLNQRLDMQSSYRALLAELLANDLADERDLGLFTASADERLKEVLLIGEPPVVGLGENGTVTLIVPKVPEVLADTSIDAGDATSATSFLSDTNEGIVGDTRDSFAGGWEIATKGRNIHFTITGRPPANTAWEVRVCAEGLDIVAAALTALATPVSSTATPSAAAPPATPIAHASPDAMATPIAQAGIGSSAIPSLPRPQYQNVNSVRWLIQSAPEAPELQIEVVTQASTLMAVRNWLLSDWRRTLATILAYTIPALLLGIGLKLVPRDVAPASKLRSTRERLSVVAWSVVRLTIAAGLSYIVFVSPTQGAWQTSPGWVPTGYPLFAIVACAVVGLGFLGERRLWWPARPRLRWRARLRLWRARLSRADAFRSTKAAAVTTAQSTPDASTVAPQAAAIEDRPGDKSKPGWLTASPGLELALALAVAAGVAACLVYLEHRWVCLSPNFCGPIRDFASVVVRSQIAPALIVASCLMFLVTAIRVWWWRSHPSPGSWPIMALPAVGALSLLLSVLRLEAHAFTGRTGQFWLAVDGGLIPVWVTACIVVGLLLFVAGLVPDEIVELVPSRVRRIVRLTHWCIASALILVAIILQWIWAIYSQESIWWRALVEADLDDRLPTIFSARLYEPLTQYPFSFFPSLGELLIALGLVGFVSLLGASGPGHTARLLAKNEKWVRWVLAGLFAVFVTGYGGQILGLRAPVAFFLGLALLPLAWSYPDPVAPDNVEGDGEEEENPQVLASRGNAPPHNMTHHANREQANAGTGDGEEGTNQADPNQPVGGASRPGAAEQATDTGAAAVGTGAAAPETTDKDASQSAKEVARRREALAHGPNQGWWKNGVLAVQLGSRLALLPIAYFMYIFLGTQGDGGWSLTTPFAVTGFVSVLINEVAFWLVSAFVLGCLFPYLIGPNGLVKGATLAAVYIAANAGAALLGIPGNALWQVRSFQLLLFLMLLGAWIDHKSLDEPSFDWKEFIGRYDLPNMSTTVFTQILPLLAALIGVVFQLTNNQTHEATTSLVSGEARAALENFLASGPRVD
jgi:hypothetical protein